MRITVPKPKIPLKGLTYEEVDGVRYPLRVPTPEVTGHPITGEMIDGVWYAIEEEEYVSEGDWHLSLLVSLFNRLTRLLHDRSSARVFADVMTYWVEENGKKKLAPDLMVLPVVEEPHRKRGSVRLWQEASWPSFVLEILSDTTSERDYEEKFVVYQEELRVPEYFLCDPELGQQQVWGYRLEGGQYQEIEADASSRVWSEQLQAWFGADAEGVLQVWDATGQQVPGYEEVVEARDAAVQRAEMERERAAAAERERDVAKSDREAQRQRAEAAEAELRELRARLQRQSPADGTPPV